MKVFFYISICIILVACSNGKVPFGIIEPTDMENILWEQMKADIFAKEFIAKNTSLDVVKENLAIQQKIFDKYKIEQKYFYKSYKYYLAHEDMLKMIVDSIVAKQTIIRDNKMKIEHQNHFQSPKDLIIRFVLKGFVPAQTIQEDTVPLFYPIYKPLSTTNTKQVDDVLKKTYE